eukprot:3224595-Rhodomonas_salina.1
MGGDRQSVPAQGPNSAIPLCAPYNIHIYPALVEYGVGTTRVRLVYEVAYAPMPLCTPCACPYAHPTRSPVLRSSQVLVPVESG